MSGPLKIRYAAKAFRDLQEIEAYIAFDSPAAARKVARAVQDTLSLLCLFPDKARRSTRNGVRAIPLSRYPYIIFYRVIGREIIVTRIFHAARRHPGFQEEQRPFAHA